MAHIFKYPENGNKGIIVFTHKEYRFFQFHPVRRDFVNPFKLMKKFIDFAMYQKKIASIKKKYFIGVHWGSFARDIVTPPWVDFHFSAPGTATFKGAPFVIPLSSANFTPEVMRRTEKEKYFDIICVAKNTNTKNYQNLMKSIRRIFDEGFTYKVVFVISSNKNEPDNKYYTNIFDDYFNMFSVEERERFTIIKTHPDIGFQGFSYTFLAHLYNQSKVFTIFSQQEGQCKVIKEAQMCGLPVVVKSDMRGGGRDYLNSENSVTFDSYDNAHESLIKAVEGFDEFNIDVEEIRKDLGELESIKKTKEYFSELYRKNGQNFDGNLVNLDNLNRRLPAHYFDKSIEWASDPDFRFKTTDITNIKMFSLFYSSIMN